VEYVGGTQDGIFYKHKIKHDDKSFGTRTDSGQMIRGWSSVTDGDRW